MTGDLHRMAVLKIQDRLPQAQTRGFSDALRAALSRDDPEWTVPADLRVIPDAFPVTPEDRSVVLFEVEVSNRSATPKWRTIASCGGRWTILAGELA